MNRRRKDKSQENRIKNQTNETQLINKEIVDVTNIDESVSKMKEDKDWFSSR